MQKSKLKNSSGTHVRLIPPAHSILNGYRLPQRDDVWITDAEMEGDALTIRNISTNHVVRLGLDQIHHFDSDQSSEEDGIKRGFLTLLVQISMEGVNVNVRPLPAYYRRLIAGALGARVEKPCQEATERALSVFSKRLEAEFRHVDERAVGAIRTEWQEISPAPNCPSADQLMRRIAAHCVSGIKAREIAVGTVVAQCLDGFPALLTAKALSTLEAIVTERFPRDLYVRTAINTSGVYQRRQAPRTKYSARVFDLHMSLIRVDSHNRAQHALANISADFAELQVLLEEAERGR